ncbi:hypothetical protein HELRODRAFT_164805 [Helobdella robusta]|uniref:Endonuclease/exonuclease/phosphatase domain-containing protein n=1 Tax=Helobdella robusta TaxID=6412 RepID=T1EVU0_HELRO|nr:hypothetical protein HELRODRAFT_164805 [Helobdella robusta]ESN92709.1 hypothetical protein HELRODRAFT_164805 [Helobdella robusta]
MGPSQLVEPHKQQQASSTMSPPSDVNSATSINHDNGYDQHFNAYNTHIDPTKNLLDSFTRQSSYNTTRDLLNILEAKYINNHDHPLPLLHINSKTWLNDETAKLVRMNDYNFVFKNRSDRISGGVGIFIRSGIEFSMINNLLLNDTIIDLLGINLKLNTHVNILVYRPLNTDPNILIQKLELILPTFKPHIKSYLIGDFNLDLNKLNSDNVVADFSNLLSSYNFLPLITSSTRISTSSCSLINNIFTNNLTSHLSGIILSDISDHFPIFAIASKSEISNHAPIKHFRNLTSVIYGYIDLFKVM